MSDSLPASDLMVVIATICIMVTCYPLPWLSGAGAST